MKMAIKISGKTFTGELFPTPTGKKICDAIPFESSVQTWGEEIYFSIPVDMPLEEDARDVLEEGELGYWPAGKAMCIFFGPTPISKGDEIRAAGLVNVIGKITGYKKDDLLSVTDGEKVVVETL